MSKVSVYTSKTKWPLPKNKKNHQICPSMTQVLLNQNKNKEALKPYKNEIARMETPKVPLKLRYRSTLSHKSLQKWLKNWFRSRVAVEPLRSIEMSTKEKTIRVPYKDTIHRISNNIIETRVTSWKDYVMCDGGEETL